MPDIDPKDRQKEIKERKILDKIEDAQAELDSRKTRIASWTYAGVILVATESASIVLGILFTQAWFIATIIVGIVIVVYAVITCIGVSDDDLTTADARKKLRTAEREYRDFVSGL